MQIQITDLEVRTPAGKRLLKIPRLEIKSGESCLFRGRSGIGKSTLLQLIGALSPLTSGNIQVGDTSLRGLSANEGARFRRDHVAFMFQRLNLIEHLTLTENLLLATPFTVAPAQITSILEKLSLIDRAHERVSVLSLGESQRVALARMLVSPARVFLADEPTSSLDFANTDKILEILAKEKGRRTIVCVSHDDRMTKFFDKVYELEEWA